MSSPGFSNATPSTSPGFSRVRVFFGFESKSESESGPVRVSKYAENEEQVSSSLSIVIFRGVPKEGCGASDMSVGTTIKQLSAK